MRWGLIVGVGSLVAAVLCVGGAVVGHVVAGDRDASQLTASCGWRVPGSWGRVGCCCRSIRPGSG